MNNHINFYLSPQKLLKIFKPESYKWKLKWIAFYLLTLFFLLVGIIFILTQKTPLDQLSWAKRKLNYYKTTNIDLSPSFRYVDSCIGELKFKSTTDTIDFVRNFVHKNSVHQIDREHYEYAFASHMMLEWIVLVDKKQKATRPHLSCGPRAMLTEVLLNHYKIENRVATVYSDDFDEVRSHTINEAYIVADSSWQVLGADYNVFYTDAYGKRLSLNELVFVKNLDSVVPMGATGKGWRINGVEHLKGFFESIQIADTVRINPTKFNVNKVFKHNDGQTAKEYFKALKITLIE